MKKIMTIVVVLFAVVAPLALSSPAHAQAANALVGTWIEVSGTTVRDGKTIYNYGTNPKGRLVIDKDGNWVAVITKPDLPKFASNNVMTGTAEENRAIAQGILAYFGTYKINPADHTIAVTVLSSSVPNWNGQVQTRRYELVGDTLTVISDRAVGGGIAKMVWKRAK